MKRRAWLLYLEKNVTVSLLYTDDSQRKWKDDLLELLEEEERGIDKTSEAKSWEPLLNQIRE